MTLGGPRPTPAQPARPRVVLTSLSGTKRLFVRARVSRSVLRSVRGSGLDQLVEIPMLEGATSDSENACRRSDGMTSAIHIVINRSFDIGGCQGPWQGSPSLRGEVSN